MALNLATPDREGVGNLIDIHSSTTQGFYSMVMRGPMPAPEDAQSCTLVAICLAMPL